MAKRPAPAKREPEANQQLVNAIIAVKHLQDFISAHGGAENALAAVARVIQLVEMTGGVEQLNAALKIVGAAEQPAELLETNG